MSNEFISGRAIWRRAANVWACIKADASTRWMIGLTKDQAKLELLRRGCSWSWSLILPPLEGNGGYCAACATNQADQEKQNAKY